MNEEKTIILSDGRTLGFVEYGDPAGTPVVFCHGFPGSHLDYLLLDAAGISERLGLRILAVDRPGTGGSTTHAGRTLENFASDISALLDALELDEVGVLALSGGGPFGLALARYLDARVRRVVMVSGMGPEKAPGTTTGISWTIPGKPAFMRRLILWLTKTGLERDPARVLEESKSTMAKPDCDLLNDDERYTETFLEVIKAGFGRGRNAALSDSKVFRRPWGFALEEVSCDVTLWHGEEDENVPPSVAVFVHDALPNSTLELIADEGHLTLARNHAERILSEFIP